MVPVNTCEGVSCRPGRECVQLTNGENECVCMARCPDHWKPVSKFDTDGFISALLQIRIDIHCGSGSGSGSMVWMIKNVEKITVAKKTLIKIAIYLSLDLHEGRPS